MLTLVKMLLIVYLFLRYQIEKYLYIRNEIKKIILWRIKLKNFSLVKDQIKKWSICDGTKSSFTRWIIWTSFPRQIWTGFALNWKRWNFSPLTYSIICGKAIRRRHAFPSLFSRTPSKHIYTVHTGSTSGHVFEASTPASFQPISPPEFSPRATCSTSELHCT